MTLTLQTEAAPAPPRTEGRFPAAWLQRHLPQVLTAAAVLGVCVMLVVTIYYTLFDLEWIAFLLGVLFAAVLSLLSQNISAQWQLARRTAQLQRTRKLLVEENVRGERAAQSLKAAETRFRTVLDASPIIVFYVDREERCRYHNSAFKAWCRQDLADIDGQPLEALLENAIYQDLLVHARQALLGTDSEYDTHWYRPDGGASMNVRLIGYPPGAQHVSGFYAVVTPAALSTAKTTPSTLEPVQTSVSLTDASEAIYREAIEQQLAIDRDPREYLLRAMEEDHFVLLEQKIEPLAQHVIPAQMCEILLRLQGEEHGILPPGRFFEVAENYCLMPAIDRWVVRKLLRSCAAMRTEKPLWRMPLYSINVSSATLRDRGFTRHVQGQLEHWGMQGRHLCFEVSHADLADRAPDIALFMQELRAFGCRFAVDSFGSEKITFAAFKDLRFDFLKIDGSIISRIANDKAELAKTRAIVLACRKMGIQTIAQFVENEATRSTVLEIGVDYAQGFGIDKPAPLALSKPTLKSVAI
ncbi:MAG: EAL domain-containing protein [Burkholderiales bacterium]